MKDWALEIEQQARSSGVSLDVLCKVSGVHRSTLTRWKQGAEGRWSTYQHLLAELRQITNPAYSEPASS